MIDKKGYRSPWSKYQSQFYVPIDNMVLGWDGSDKAGGTKKGDNTVLHGASAKTARRPKILSATFTFSILGMTSTDVIGIGRLS